MDEMDLRLPIFILPKSQYSKQKKNAIATNDNICHIQKIILEIQ